MPMQQSLASLAVKCLQSPPFEPALARLSRLNKRESQVLLKWMDEGGLSLYLLDHLKSFGMSHKLPDLLREQLTFRLHANHARTEDLFSKFVQINDCLQEHGVTYMFLKGFTLTPEFCPSIYLRHQLDIDVLISPRSVVDAKEALTEAGYILELEHSNGELTFVNSIPEAYKRNHSIFGIQSFTRVEIHQSIWEKREGISLYPPEQLFRISQERHLAGVTYPGLSSVSMLIFQLLHSFRHFLSSWVRQSWLYEISYFLNRNKHNDELWDQFVTVVRQDVLTSYACGLVLALCSLAFDTCLSEPVVEFFAKSLPYPIQRWVRVCGERFVLSDMRGSKLNRMLLDYFSPEPTSGISLLPPLKNFSDSFVKEIRDPERTATSIPQFLLKRLWFHTSALVEYLWYSYNWRRTLASDPSSQILCR